MRPRARAARLRPPGAAKISIALTRLPATTRGTGSARWSSIPAVPAARASSSLLGRPFRYTDEVRARVDLRGFDPRGIMCSNVLQCVDSPDDWPPPLPIAFPITRDDEQSWIASERLVTSACELRAGPIMNHMSTANVARDPRRPARGGRRSEFSYAGVSYLIWYPERQTSALGGRSSKLGGWDSNPQPSG